uniref:E3 ubiquitin-protein ligase n=1 Tax=Phallusia mammillata TaxID=59560 RepID=A0A6F9DAU3_9ASCI|nr:Deltex protein [Phallusia mammillata]
MPVSAKDCQIVVWEVQNELYPSWQMFDADFCWILEDAYAKYKKNPKLNRIAKLTQNRAFDFRELEEVDRATGRTCPIRRLELPSNCALAKQILWMWDSSAGGSPDWKPYPAEAINFIEKNYNKDMSIVDLSNKFASIDLNYTIDFQRQLQINNKTQNQRGIKRDKLKSPYPKLGSAIQSSISDDEKDQPETTSNEPTYKYSKSTTVPTDLKSFAIALPDVPKEDCCICMGSLQDESGFPASPGEDCCHVLELKQCQHKFHALCLKAAFNSDKSKSLMCPYCKKIYGEKTGIQPPGQMTDRIINQRLPGFNCRTISITYSIHNGVQTQGHPNPGQPYNAIGFPRQAFLPDNKEGQKILKLLKVAWKRKLIFTIGRSVTNGWDNCVTWNEIHHKTSMYHNSAHGYPDPGYFTNVIEELKAQGVTEADI